MQDIGLWQDILITICAVICGFVLLINGLRLFDEVLNHIIAPILRHKWKNEE